jgi:hypothetical protein
MKPIFYIKVILWLPVLLISGFASLVLIFIGNILFYIASIFNYLIGMFVKDMYEGCKGTKLEALFYLFDKKDD